MYCNGSSWYAGVVPFNKYYYSILGREVRAINKTEKIANDTGRLFGGVCTASGRLGSASVMDDELDGRDTAPTDGNVPKTRRRRRRTIHDERTTRNGRTAALSFRLENRPCPICLDRYSISTSLDRQRITHSHSQ